MTYVESLLHNVKDLMILQGRTQGGVGVNPPLELDILQKFYYLRQEINSFYILFAC